MIGDMGPLISLYRSDHADDDRECGCHLYRADLHWVATAPVQRQAQHQRRPSSQLTPHMTRPHPAAPHAFLRIWQLHGGRLATIEQMKNVGHWIERTGIRHPDGISLMLGMRRTYR
jgi:hypothetical protein